MASPVIQFRLKTEAQREKLSQAAALLRMSPAVAARQMMVERADQLLAMKAAPKTPGRCRFCAKTKLLGDGDMCADCSEL